MNPQPNNSRSEQIHLRLPPSLLARIKSATFMSGRSVNAEIVVALENAFPSPVVDVAAVDMVIHYVASAPNTGELRDRIEEVNQRFINSGSSLRIMAQPNGSLTIVTEDA